MKLFFFLGGGGGMKKLWMIDIYLIINNHTFNKLF